MQSHISQRFRFAISFFLMVAVSALVLSATVSAAHEIRPSIADFSQNEDGSYEVRIQVNLEAILTGIGSEHEDTDEAANAGEYNALREMEPGELQAAFEKYAETFRQKFTLKFDETVVSPDIVSAEIAEVGDTDIARESVIIARGQLPEGASTLTWQWPQEYGASVIRMDAAPGEAEGYSAYLSAGETSEAISLTDAGPRGFFDVVVEYIVIGFTHILPKGLDHILFVVGLFLLSTKLKPLIWQISAFTLAHTVTLALGTLGYVNISPAIVEPLIALSIAYVAVENIMTSKLHAWRPVIVFLFGLLHGLGFAGVLGEIGLSQTYFVTGLIAFNVGVELGQLTVIAICFALVGYWFGDKPWYRRMIVIPASVLIAVIALWWVYERVFLG